MAVFDTPGSPLVVKHRQLETSEPQSLMNIVSSGLACIAERLRLYDESKGKGHAIQGNLDKAVRHYVEVGIVVYEHNPLNFWVMSPFESEADIWQVLCTCFTGVGVTKAQKMRMAVSWKVYGESLNQIIARRRQLNELASQEMGDDSERQPIPALHSSAASPQPRSNPTALLEILKETYHEEMKLTLGFAKTLLLDVFTAAQLSRVLIMMYTASMFSDGLECITANLGLRGR